MFRLFKDKRIRYHLINLVQYKRDAEALALMGVPPAKPEDMPSMQTLEKYSIRQINKIADNRQRAWLIYNRALQIYKDQNIVKHITIDIQHTDEEDIEIKATLKTANFVIPVKKELLIDYLKDLLDKSRYLLKED